MRAQSKGRRIAAWVLIGLISAVFILSAVAKLAAAQAVVDMFQKWGLSNHLVLIGIMELISAILFVIPRTHSLGLLLLTAYLGGAIVTHMAHDEPYISPAVFLAAVWLASFLRHPELLQSFHRSAP
ncbi:MAG TPA: DoxX family protein [Pyrinomonadaceae bacterium]|nr:DoxX family protein [Pyrinomonadaceae bacterium]